MALRFAIVGAMLAVIGVSLWAISTMLPWDLSNKVEKYGTGGFVAGVTISCVGMLAWVWTLIP